jgi:hypothetical protein
VISGTELPDPDDVLRRFALKLGGLSDWLDAAEVMERVRLCRGEAGASVCWWVSGGWESGEGTVRFEGRRRGGVSAARVC